MDQARIKQAAALLWQTRLDGRRIEALPPDLRPATLSEGYAVQDAMAEVAGPVVGWKIAATSAAGQKHIGVTEPLAGRLFRDFRLEDGARRPAKNMHMRVAEAEFAFRIARDLGKRGKDYAMPEVRDAIAAMHLAIELPDARYVKFDTIGPAAIAADDAFADWFIIGTEVHDWQRLDLPNQPVRGIRNGAVVAEGSGANALGDPRLALTWLANHLARHGPGLKAGDVVITGTCVKPVAIGADDTMIADFGALGRVTVGFD